MYRDRLPLSSTPDEGVAVAPPARRSVDQLVPFGTSADFGVCVPSYHLGRAFFSPAGFGYSKPDLRRRPVDLGELGVDLTEKKRALVVPSTPRPVNWHQIRRMHVPWSAL